jgi:hypothetical protein
VDLDVVLLDDHAGPDARHQFVLADHVAVGRDKHAEQIESATAELDRRAVAQKLASSKIETKSTYARLIPVHRFSTVTAAIQDN